MILSKYFAASGSSLASRACNSVFLSSGPRVAASSPKKRGQSATGHGSCVV